MLAKSRPAASVASWDICSIFFMSACDRLGGRCGKGGASTSREGCDSGGGGDAVFLRRGSAAWIEREERYLGGREGGGWGHGDGGDVLRWDGSKARWGCGVKQGSVLRWVTFFRRGSMAFFRRGSVGAGAGADGAACAGIREVGNTVFARPCNTVFKG